MNARVIWLIDNEAAREGLVKSFSPTLFSREILMQDALVDIDLQCMNWYSRVPSCANVADGPSRLDFKFMMELRAFRKEAARVTLEELKGEGLFNLWTNDC